MGIEAKINHQLNKFPAIKKVIKRMYQLAMYTISPKIKSEGNIVRVSPDDGKEYFFGYYDKSPWDSTGRYMLCMKAEHTWSDVSPKKAAEIILIDTQNNNAVTVIAKTNSWNVQMGCMLQWLGPDYSTRILFNDFRDGKYASVILTLATKEEKVIPFPVYSVATDGSFALSLDFSRLYRLRPGYGYYNLPEETANEKLPDKPCIWYVGLNNGEVKPILKYSDFAGFEPRPEMDGAEHKVNHIMLSPSGERFMVLHRWFQGQRKYTRLVTCNVDGTDMFNLSDDDMVSHCFWKNDGEILAFENKKDTGSGYYLMKDKTNLYEHVWEFIDNDGHPSYSSLGVVVTDSYPNKARVAEIKIMPGVESVSCPQSIARVFAPFKYDNNTRCDLHPRWSRDGKKVCFDSVFEGHRGLYVVDVSDKVKRYEEKLTTQPLVSCVIPTYKRSDMLVNAINSVLQQTYKNIEVLVVDDNEPGDKFSVASRTKVEGIGDDRVHFITQEYHKNGAAARNVGIKKSNGKYIAFLDDDDFWLPDKIEKQVAYLEQHDDVAGVSCLYTQVLAGKPIRKCPPYKSDNMNYKVLGREVAVFTSTVLLKKEMLLEAGIFNENLIRHQDLQLLSDFTFRFEWGVIPEYLTILNIDSDINRIKNAEKLADAKKAFFAVEEDKILSFDKKKRRTIYAMHYFEIVLIAFRAKDISMLLKYVFKIGFNLSAYKAALRRIREKKAYTIR